MSVNNRTVEALSENFNALQLKRLILCFDDKIVEKALETFMKRLEDSINLEGLKLKFSSPGRVRETDMILLSQSLTKLNLLKDLNLHFDLSVKISEKELIALSGSFERLPSLKSLSLSLPSLSNLTRRGFYAFKDGLRKAKFLERIFLYLIDLTKVADEDIQQFMESLEELPSLANIDIFFNGFPKLTEKGLNAMSESLKRMRSLQSFKFGLIWCKNISEQNVRDFAGKLLEGSSIKLDCRYEGQELYKILDTKRRHNFERCGDLDL